MCRNHQINHSLLRRRLPSGAQQRSQQRASSVTKVVTYINDGAKKKSVRNKHAQ